MSIKQVIQNQKERAEIARRWWRELEALADAGDIAGFYSHYRGYLEWANIVSKYRTTIYKMAGLVVEHMIEQTHPVKKKD